MTVYLAWTDAELPQPPPPGPWLELWPAAPSLVLVDSPDTLSRVYHELKWALPEGAALLVAPVASVPKLKGLRPGTQTWLRDRLPRH